MKSPTAPHRFSALTIVLLTLGLLGTGPACAQVMGGGMMGGGMMGGGGGSESGPPPDLQSSAGRAYARTCAQCHALPSPRQHTAAQWPGVVRRMERIMLSTGRPMPSRQTLEVIVKYLQDHAESQ
ncbi:MAG: hypothetical protein P8124_12760 [Gammaproteobacteria bacterium]